jgi:hypothetical protein
MRGSWRSSEKTEEHRCNGGDPDELHFSLLHALFPVARILELPEPFACGRVFGVFDVAEVAAVLGYALYLAVSFVARSPSS